MGALGIRARFPMGMFLGHVGVGQRSPYPDVTRLHAALMHAAGKGLTAVVRDGDLRPSEAALVALRWLEEHPPTALEHPLMMAVARESALSWRAEGVHEGGRAAPRERKTLRAQSDATALAGPIGWGWQEDVPDEVLETLRVLCEDVSCLGEADSPVVLEVGDIQPTHLARGGVNELTRWAPGEIRLSTPVRGRVTELEAAYEKSRPSKAPTPALDRHSWTQQPGAPAPARTLIRDIAYAPIEPPRRIEPWTSAIVLNVDRELRPEERVRWCVAVHRSLASLLQEARPVVTGAYAEGEKQPANRVAIHYVEATFLPGDDTTGGGFVVMVPAVAEPTDLAPLERAARALKQVYLRRTDAVTVRGVTTLDPGDFWPAPAPGMRRLWSPVPGLVPETRRQRRGEARWTLEDAALLAVGHAFRDRLEPLDTGDRYRAVIGQVRGWGVEVHDVRRIADSRVERYAHKTPPGVVVQPYTATFDLTDLVGERTLFALGQSRHLGGGLMYPVDYPAAVIEAMRGATGAAR